MDNIFAYLGELGSRDSLTNKNRMLFDVFPETRTGKTDFSKYITVTDTAKRNRLQEMLTGRCEHKYVKTIDSGMIADEVVASFRQKYPHDLSLTGGYNTKTRTGDAGTEAFVMLEDLTKDLILRRHDKNMASVYDNNEGKPGPLRQDHNATEQTQARLDKISRLFRDHLGAGRGKIPVFLSKVRALLDEFSLTENEKSVCDNKLSFFYDAFSDGRTALPTAEKVSAYKKRRFLKELEYRFNADVMRDFEKELRFLMIAGREYTDSLYRLKIRNRNNTGKSEYISAFDKDKRNIKRLLEHSSIKFSESGQEKFMEGFELGPAILSNQQTAKTVLPHFIRRVFDTGILEGKVSEREALMHSLYDVGPVLGLVGVSTVWRNPYLLPIGDTGENGSASVCSFLSAFSCVPLDIWSAKDALAGCREEAEKEMLPKQKQKALEYLDTMIPEKLAVFGQFFTERLTNACLLSKAYRLRNSTPYRKYLRQSEELLTRKKMNALQDGLQDYFDFYLDRIIKELMILPMPATRLRILSFLEDFIDRRVNDPLLDDTRRLTPAGIFGCLEILSEKIGDLVRYWTETVIPIHILYYHLIVSECLTIEKEASTDTDKYFQDMYGFYRFFETNNGKTDICPPLCDNMRLEPLRAIEDPRSFDLYAGRFYNYFMEETYRIVLSRNFFQQYKYSVNKHDK